MKLLTFSTLVANLLSIAYSGDCDQSALFATLSIIAYRKL